jgi:hypothetical protein
VYHPGAGTRASIITAVIVRPVGHAPREAAPHRKDLGRVLVTIDDLAALMPLLKQDAPDLEVEFDDGYFTEAEELRTLSDMEMKSFRLKTPKVQVVLSPPSALRADLPLRSSGWRGHCCVRVC